MKAPVILIGIGEMAGVFARGLLRIGHPVFPVTRDSNMQEMAEALPTPALVLVAVAENDLHKVLTDIPEQWRNHLGLLQNELLPKDWQQHQIDNPTVISVWFEKKKGQDAKVLIPSPVYGPAAPILAAALNAIDIPCTELTSEQALLFELTRKNVYILTTNIAGLTTGGNVAELWQNHQTLARDVTTDVVTIQQWLTRETLDQEALIKGMVEAFDGDPEHKCMGRSAPARLARALEHARQGKLNVPALERINP